MPGLHVYDICEDYVIYNNNREIKENVSIMHFAQQNPWDMGRKNEAFKIWWEYARRTPFYHEILEECYCKAEEYIISQPDRISQNENKLRYIDMLLDDNSRDAFLRCLKNRRIKRIMVYGASRIARMLEWSIRGTGIEIECFIDKSYRGEFCSKPTIYFDDIKKFTADIIVVSNSSYVNEVREDLKGYTTLPIITIDEVLS